VKSFVAVILALGLLLLSACHTQPSPPAAASAPTNNLPAPLLEPGGEDEVIATIRGDTITRKDLEPVLLEGYGLNVLLDLVQLDLVRQEANRLNIDVTPQDIESERAITMQNLQHATEQMDASGQPTTQPENITPEQEEQLLDQLLIQQHVSRAEFNVILRVNAYLRKIAGPKVDEHLTDEAVRKQFNAMYGERVVIHYIVCNNMGEVADVRRALAMGQSFEDVARLKSRDRRTGALGGELPPFTMADNRFPDEFKQLCFNLKIGEVSDPVQIGRFIYIAKLVDRIPPATAKFEDYKDSVRKQLYDDTVQAAMKAMRDRLGHIALESLHIHDRMLAQQWQDRIEAATNSTQTDEQIRHELDAEHQPTTTQPATEAAPPATMPATAR
jgi:foldase protein PrsA